MVFTYIIIFLFILILAMIVVYFIRTYVIPKKIEEIEHMIESGQTKLAIKKLTDMLEKDDRNAYAHYLLAQAHVRENNAKFAILEYRQVLKYNKYNEKYTEEKSLNAL